MKRRMDTFSKASINIKGVPLLMTSLHRLLCLFSLHSMFCQSPITSVYREQGMKCIYLTLFLDHQQQLHIMPIKSTILGNPVLTYPDSQDLFTTQFPLFRLDITLNH